jgi:adenylate cyclase
VVRTPDAAPKPPPAAAAPYSPIATNANLPNADHSPDHDQGWFADGLAEEIIDALCCVRGLRVASRSAAFRFRDGSVDPREVGRQLGVDAILEGSVRKSGDRLRVGAQLVDAATGFRTWSETFERRIEDVFAIQGEIARQVGQALRVTVAGAALGRSERYAPRNLDAYEYYLRGRQMTGGTGMSQAALLHAPVLFRKAIELDPDYAQAHAGLADTLAQLVLWRSAKADDVLAEATAAASRALDLAPDLPEALVAQGHLRSLAGDAAGAMRSFERALELAPSLYEANYYFARHLFAQGDHVRAAQRFLAAWQARPDDGTLLVHAGNALDASGDRMEGEATARRALAALLRQMEFEPENARLHYMAAGAHMRLGDIDAGRREIETALRLRPDDFVTLYNAACFHSLAGDAERALDLLERAIPGGGNRDWMANDPDLANLRGHPRFEAVLEQLA